MRGPASLRRFDAVKRVMDCLAAGVVLAVASPVFVVVGGLVAVKLGRPILFKQNRPGLNGHVFRLYKFRTMKSIDESKGLVSDQQRLTPFGRILRSSSLDELPTLINVLRGEMSIVGPRPLLVQYLSRYSPEQARRHEVRPGITGLAQASGRNGLDWEAKFALDIVYVEHRSAALDAKILWRTLAAVTGRQGISAPGEATMAEFKGEASELNPSLAPPPRIPKLHTIRTPH